jgi:opacity protein-like surface antigen
MKILLAAAALVVLAGPALAQSPQNPSNQQDQQANAQSSQQNLVAAQKIKQDLQKQGFTDVKIVAESFVVQGKSPDGDPVVMTIGPHGMSVFEAINENGSKSGTVGSNNSSSNDSSSNSTTSPSGKSGMQK